MNCRNCGEQMEGDGYTVAIHCPNVDVSDMTPDCDPVHCETDERVAKALIERYTNYTNQEV